MATSKEAMQEGRTYTRYHEAGHRYQNGQEKIFVADSSFKCPVYVHRTPPCQGGCPAGEDIRGWLQIVRGLDQPPEGTDWREYAFQRATDANPFPSVMGRVCPAPCESGCNRNELEDFVGINSVEQFIGDTAYQEGYRYAEAPPLSGRHVAVVGGGPAGLAAAYQLRRKGHAVTIFEAQEQLGGMMVHGIPEYRTPRDILRHEIDRILALGDIEVRTGVRVGKDVPMERIEAEHDAILWAVGAQSGRPLPVPGADAPNCISGVQFLEAFNKGQIALTARRIVCIGGGDTSVDVVSVARRIGRIDHPHETDHPEDSAHGYVASDAATQAAHEGAHAILTSRYPKENMAASEHEIRDALREGVEIVDGVMPVEVIKDDAGKARAIRMIRCEVQGNEGPVAIEGSEFEIECDMVVAAIGQTGDLEGLETLDNGRGFMEADPYYRIPGREKHFVAGDIIRPHLLTTAIGQASIAADSIEHFFNEGEVAKRPKVDVHHFNLLQELKEKGLEPVSYDHAQVRGTAGANFAIHNFEDRAANEVIDHKRLFLGHFKYEPRHLRQEKVPDAESVLGHFEERTEGLSEEEARAEAARCMSCGMCFECDNCLIYCPQDAIHRVDKKERALGRYVDTDYGRCVGCHICKDVCPTGYIDMGMGD